MRVVIIISMTMALSAITYNAQSFNKLGKALQNKVTEARSGSSLGQDEVACIKRSAKYWGGKRSGSIS